MDFSDITSAFGSLNKFLNQKKKFPVLLARSLENKYNYWIGRFFLNFIFLIIINCYFVLLFNHKKVSEFIGVDWIYNLIILGGTLVTCGPIIYLIHDLSLKVYFSEEYKKIKYYKKNKGYEKTTEMLKKYEKKRVCNYLFHSVSPIIVLIFGIVSTLKFDMWMSILTAIMYFSVSLLLSYKYEDLFSADFYVLKTTNSINDDEIKGYIIVKINDKCFYYNEEEEVVIFHEENYYFLKRKINDFYIIEYELLQEFLIEKLSELKSNEEKDGNLIQTIEKIIDSLKKEIDMSRKLIDKR